MVNRLIIEKATTPFKMELMKKKYCKSKCKLIINEKQPAARESMHKLNLIIIGLLNLIIKSTNTMSENTNIEKYILLIISII